VGLGVLINRTARRVEDAQWANRRLLGRRLELYEKMAPLLNDLYCFFRLVGRFLEIKPPRARPLKRELDKLFHVNRFLFSPRFAEAYDELMQTYFRTWTGKGQPAKIKSPVWFQLQERTEANWEPKWEAAMFDPAAQFAATDLEALGRYVKSIDAAHNTLMTVFAEEVGVRPTSDDARHHLWPRLRPRQPEGRSSITAAPASGAKIVSRPSSQRTR